MYSIDPYYIKAYLDYIDIKFSDSVSADTLINANFTLSIPDATPNTITNPFNLIVLTRDYYSISRTLRLWFSFDLAQNTLYQLYISGLRTVINTPIDSGTFPFKTLEIAPSVPHLPPSREPVDTEDYSIKNISISLLPNVPATDVSVLEAGVISPVEAGYYLTSSSAEGRIAIQFNQAPAANFITSDYFKVQRKLVIVPTSLLTIPRWENVNALITADTVNSVIYIYLPSSDATPLYGIADKVYWQTGYKYRVKILAGIGI